MNQHTTPTPAALALHQDTQRIVLPNGLTLLVRQDRSAPVVAIVTYVKAGYFDETDDVVGIAHVLEHMYFKGTPTRGVGDIARETKSLGGYLNAHTIYDHTSYYTVLPSDALREGLEIQSDAFARSLIDREELARELDVIIQEAKRKRDTPSAVTLETLFEVLHDRHRIRRWRIGEAEALRELTQEQLLRFYRRWYRPDNTIVCVVGNVDPTVVEREVASLYGGLEAGLPARDRGPSETALPGQRFRSLEGDIVQAQLAFGWRAPSQAHPDTPALDLAGTILSAGRASRLYQAVRERELASSVSAWHYPTGDIGVFVAHAEAPMARAAEAGRTVWREVQAMRTAGVNREELHRAKRILEARWLRRLESMEGQAQYLAAWEAEGGHEQGAAYYDALMAVESSDMQRAMQAHCDPAQVSVVSYRPSGSAPIDLEALLHEASGTSRRHMAARPLEQHEDVVVAHGRQGVPVLIHARPGAPMAHVGLYLRGGTLHEPADGEGLARLTAQVMLKGTERMTARAIAEATENLGASIGVSVGLESLGWSLSVPTAHLGPALAILGEVVQRPVFPTDAVTTERTLALAEVARARDDMYRWPMRLATKAAYGGHPYARSVLGTERTLAAIDAEQLRAFHAAHILHSEAVLAVVGDVSAAEVAMWCDDAFSGLQLAPGVAVPPMVWPATSLEQVEERVREQTALALLFPSPGRRDPQRYAVHVLSAIASGLGGRLFEALRDRQSLAYTVSAFASERSAGGHFAAYIATSPEREDEARAGLLRELARFAEAPPSLEEVTRAQRYLVGTHAIAQQSGGQVLAEMVDCWLFGDGLPERHQERAAIEAVTQQAVYEVAQRLFTTHPVISGVVRGGGGQGSHR